jgi:hypothetical protein
MPQPSGLVGVEDLDAAGTLAAGAGRGAGSACCGGAGAGLGLRWADLHADDPGDEGQPAGPGGTGLVRLGGVGTPEVQDLSICELAVARGQHTLATRALVADGLDLRHRLPGLYTAVGEGRCDLWVARRVASMTRRLDPPAAALVDRAVVDAVDQGPGRLLGSPRRRCWRPTPTRLGRSGRPGAAAATSR